MRNNVQVACMEAINKVAEENGYAIKGKVTSGDQEIYISEETKEIFLNPGTGKCDEGTFEQAMENIKQFISDCEVELIIHEYSKKPDENNRYMFKLGYDAVGILIRFEVLMPGVPLDSVRYMEEAEQNIWDFPRLYLDDNSLVWKYALITKKHLYETMMNMIAYHRKNMQLRIASAFTLGLLGVIGKHSDKSNVNIDELIEMTIDISKIADSFNRGFRKRDIEEFDKYLARINDLVA